MVGERVRRRVFEVGQGQVGAPQEIPHRPGIAGSPRGGERQAKDRAAGVPGDLGGAAGEGEVDALAEDLDLLVDAAIEEDVAARRDRPCRGGIEWVGVRR